MVPQSLMCLPPVSIFSTQHEWCILNGAPFFKLIFFCSKEVFFQCFSLLQSIYLSRSMTLTGLFTSAQCQVKQFIRLCSKKRLSRIRGTVIPSSKFFKLVQLKLSVFRSDSLAKQQYKSTFKVYSKNLLQEPTPKFYSRNLL